MLSQKQKNKHDKIKFLGKANLDTFEVLSCYL